MSRTDLGFREYAAAVMAEVRRLLEVGVIVQHKEPVQDNKAFRFDLPQGISRLREKAGEELAVDSYVRQIHEAEEWGILFKDRSVAMLTFQIDNENSNRDTIVPSSFCYLFAAPSGIIGKESEDAHFFRIEMHPNASGTLFGEPVVHLHGNKNKAPRFGISTAISPLDFIDFVVRNRFAEDWKNIHVNLVDLMEELHDSHTNPLFRHKIRKIDQYENLVNKLNLLDHQRRLSIPNWQSPPTALRYPFAL